MQDDAGAEAPVAERQIQLVGLGDSLMAGYQLQGSEACRASWKKCCMTGAECGDQQCRGFGRHQRRRAFPGGLVGAGRHGWRDPGTGRQ